MEDCTALSEKLGHQMATAGWKESVPSRVQAALVRGSWHLDLTVLENEAKVRPRSGVKETKSLNKVQGREMKLYLGLGMNKSTGQPSVNQVPTVHRDLTRHE